MKRNDGSERSSALPVTEQVRRGPAVLAPHEVAALLRVVPNTVRNGIRRGEIKSVRVGRSFRIPREEVLRLLGEAVA